MPTHLLALRTSSPRRTLERLRLNQPAVIARTQDDLVLLDPRTVLPEQEEDLLNALRQALVG
jgi:L-seryl-tRNA(Ser) seleniumtransferase